VREGCIWVNSTNQSRAGLKRGGAVSGRTPVYRRGIDRVYKVDSMELQSALGTGKDSEMAPQALEISQNGLGDPWLPVLG